MMQHSCFIGVENGKPKIVEKEKRFTKLISQQEGCVIWITESNESLKQESLSVKEAVSRGPEPFLLRYTPFCAYMSKYIFLVRITKCVIAKSDYMPVFTIERTEPHLKPGI